MCPACTEIERLRTELADERTAHAKVQGLLDLAARTLAWPLRFDDGETVTLSVETPTDG